MSVLNPLALPDGYITKWQVHNPPPGMKHVFEPYLQYMPQHDDRYAGIVLKGGQVAKVVMTSDLDANGVYSTGETQVANTVEPVRVETKQAHCENCAELRAKLDDALAKLADLETEKPEDPRTLAELRRLCKANGLRADGNKEALVARLVDAGVA